MSPAAKLRKDSRGLVFSGEKFMLEKYGSIAQLQRMSDYYRSSSHPHDENLFRILDEKLLQAPYLRAGWVDLEGFPKLGENLFAELFKLYEDLLERYRGSRKITTAQMGEASSVDPGRRTLDLHFGDYGIQLALFPHNTRTLQISISLHARQQQISSINICEGQHPHIYTDASYKTQNDMLISRLLFYALLGNHRLLEGFLENAERNGEER
jgi:hypothetical protein